MFDFLDKDWFVISLEIFFLLFIVYDAKRYFETKKKEYLTNIVLTLAFFVWTAIPFYNSYITWDDAKKQQRILACGTIENNVTLCECLGDATFKEYSYEAFESLDKNSSDFTEFIKETKEDCADDSWF